ncbi:MAG: hypothetical protein KC588_16880, partial [Nitrospira sp.]|nr:hypothetical protein [Nitrospira sp.]
EKTEQLVSYFQSLAGISPSTGWLDLSTLQAMDRWLGIKAAKVKDPKRIGNPKKSLEIEGESVAFLTDKENAVVAHIFFPTNGADLEKDDLGVLEKVADFFDMQGATGLTFNVLGFADKREKVNFNQMLGEERTASVDEKLRELLTRRLNRVLLVVNSCRLGAWIHKMPEHSFQPPKNSSGNKRFASSSKG